MRTMWRARPPRMRSVRPLAFGKRPSAVFHAAELEETCAQPSGEVLRVARRLLEQDGMKNSRNRHQPTCRFCSADLEHTFVDLGMHPPCQKHVEPQEPKPAGGKLWRLDVLLKEGIPMEKAREILKLLKELQRPWWEGGGIF